ncbi:HAD family hydrolase [Mesobacterium sp. TK19101]|uniref:HAD family hydrolase n=1 Tax=Mesobacterium hydrothermale TaxID=3111907 RepID=A0ABU6HDW2_9RHOB|nr:HAD family hydrolase [Mesobacterium sp. TK19101]MEC3860654.1 HAD family hydrolase [Mesobacterium sp. TK19101]
MKIAMWSGPRNLSTALMYAFGNRPDFTVIDEPFYGPYLRLTGLTHPMRAKVLESRQDGPEDVAAQLLAPLPEGRHAYHKHMCQHMIPGIPRGFMADCVNVFLIRHPARVIASFAKGYKDLTADDVGFRLQAELYDHCLSLGQSPVVIDSADIRDDPAKMLGKLCAAIGLPFDPAMLNWPAGGHPADGVWAPHWYRSVHASTGFAGPEGPLPKLDAALLPLLEETLPFYNRMKVAKLAP